MQSRGSPPEANKKPLWSPLETSSEAPPVHTGSSYRVHLKQFVFISWVSCEYGGCHSIIELAWQAFNSFSKHLVTLCSQRGRNMQLFSSLACPQRRVQVVGPKILNEALIQGYLAVKSCKVPFQAPLLLPKWVHWKWFISGTAKERGVGMVEASWRPPPAFLE